MSASHSPDASTAAHKKRAAQPRTSSSRRRITLVIICALIVTLVLWALIAGNLLRNARDSLHAAEQSLPVARAASADTDLDLAAAALESANTDLVAARTQLRNPFLAPLRFVPVLGDDLQTATAMADSGVRVTASGLDVLTAITEQPGTLAAFAPANGTLPVTAIAALAPPLRAMSAATQMAIADLKAAPPSGRVTELTDGHQRLLTLLQELAPSLDTGAALAEQLPSFLGQDGPRTYLLGAATPAEARNVVGFIGSIAPMTFTDGTPQLGTFISTNDLPIFPPDELSSPAPADPVWDRYGGTGSWLNANRTPDFPTAARVFERLWHAHHGAPVDGFIVVDPFALAGLLEVAGPTALTGATVLDADSVVNYVANEAYADFEDDDQRRQVLGAVAARSLNHFLAGETADPQRTLEVLADLVAGGHLRVHATDDVVQAAIATTPLAGRLADSAGDFVSVTTYSGSASKIDHYAERNVDLEVTLLGDGAARSELRVTLGNTAPTSGQPSYVIGPNVPDLDAGDNLLDVSVHLAPGAQFTVVPDPSDAGPSFTEVELRRPVHRGWTRLTSGQTTERSYAWMTREAWDAQDGTIAYEVVVQGQTTIRPTDLRISVRVPDGFAPLMLPDGADENLGEIRWDGQIRGETIRIPLRFAPLER